MLHLTSIRCASDQIRAWVGILGKFAASGGRWGKLCALFSAVWCESGYPVTQRGDRLENGGGRKFETRGTPLGLGLGLGLGWVARARVTRCRWAPIFLFHQSWVGFYLECAPAAPIAIRLRLQHDLFCVNLCHFYARWTVTCLPSYTELC